jgi:hypothetical protein
MDKLNIMLVKTLKKGGFGFFHMGPHGSPADCKSSWVASNGSRETQEHEIGYQVTI